MEKKNWNKEKKKKEKEKNNSIVARTRGRSVSLRSTLPSLPLHQGCYHNSFQQLWIYIILWTQEGRRSSFASLLKCLRVTVEKRNDSSFTWAVEREQSNGFLLFLYIQTPSKSTSSLNPKQISSCQSWVRATP